MYIYLSKKISIPHGLQLRSLSWNAQQGWLACGTDHGIVKVLKLQDASGVKDDGFFTTQSNLSMNQTLEGHRGSILVVNWNQNYRKLTSSDENGLIIVWILHKGMWFEEMINNRSTSVVRDMRWSSDGRKICFIYEDGHAVLGNVDGNRIWGKELNHRLVLVEWSPDGRLVLLCTKEGKCLLYDCHGSFVSSLALRFEVDSDIVGLHWYDGFEGLDDTYPPILAIALESGKIQLMRHELDGEPILVTAEMTTASIRWNPNGTVLAVAGYKKTQEDTNSIVKLFSPLGFHLRTLHVPNTKVRAVTWEGTGLRLAIGVDASIYLASIRPDYKWTFIGQSTCVYSFKKKHPDEHCVMFWDVTTGDRYLKHVNRLCAVCGSGGHCVLATKEEEPNQYILILCNAIGNPLESNHMTIEPVFMTMNENQVFVASKTDVYVWNYRDSLPLLPSKQLLSSFSNDLSKESKDHTYCLDWKINTGINQDRKSEFERKAVWNMKWADDNPDLIVIMERSRMYVLRGTELEEPVSCNAYFCSFHNLQVLAIRLDDVMQQPEQPTRAHIFSYETKSLRDTHQILQAVEIQDAYSYVEEHGHPRLWTSLAEHALEHLDFSVAAKAFVKCKNYYGIQFVKKVEALRDKNLQNAEVCAYFRRFEDAERIYINIDRKDLAIHMRMKMGDWFLVEKLLENFPGNNSLLKLTWNNIGDHFVVTQNWNDAERYYSKAKNFQMLAECYSELQHWTKLQKLMDYVEDGSPLLESIARKFMNIGVCEHAHNADSLDLSDMDIRNAWHNAEAYHLWMLAHRELYSGNLEQAAKVSWWLKDYEDVLQPHSIYSLIALTSYFCGYYEQCSRAFTVLELNRSIPEQERKDYKEMAASIFSRHQPVSNAKVSSGIRKCLRCGVSLEDELKRRCPTPKCTATFPICMASGTQILHEDFVKCGYCKSLMISSKLKYKHQTSAKKYLAQ
ncbi:WD repeat-containing protein 35-like [Selaginella moellendorffii]|uniref:WD repeat-containing protein 35-like n=1 Tax=Selaginella moellendorffii TaxID=88036 RepID=UPI000D1C6722|nr:WD repeat-containing protein 35-like [Selaginella moellendorffii]|eukprot:XP_024530250.1 WD repeat-containing protein 35-like [Selaginella moellendorffii]